MFNIEKEFKYKNCGKEQSKSLSWTPVYKINNNKSIYIPVYCCQCKALHYIVEGATSIPGDKLILLESEVESIEEIGSVKC